MSGWPPTSDGGHGDENRPASSLPTDPTSPVSSPAASSYPALTYLPTSQAYAASPQYVYSPQHGASQYNGSQYAASQYATLQYAPQQQSTPSQQQYVVQPQYAPQQQYPTQQQYGVQQQYAVSPYAASPPYQAAQYLSSYPGTQQTYQPFQQQGLPPSPPSTGNDPLFSLVPSWEDYCLRNGRHSQEAAQHPQSLPNGWPVQFQGKQAWTRDVLLDPRNGAEWLYDINQQDNDAIERALRAFQDWGRAHCYISPASFPVGEPLSQRLKDIGAKLYNHRGIFLLRGLELNRYDEREIVIVHAGLSSYIGARRAYQRENDSMFAHIKDRSREPSEDGLDLPLTSTSDEIGFHTDIGDIISNLMIQPAASGGTSYFASGTQVYNDLANKRPDIIRRLTQNWRFDIFPSLVGQKPALDRPLLYNAGVHATMLCFRQPFVTSAPNYLRQGSLPEISSAEKEALDAIHYTARERAIGLDLKRGDLVFVNNLLVLHARAGYTDQGKPRHVQRLIVRDPGESWRLPKGLADIWGMIDGDPSNEWKNEVFNLDDLRDQKALWKLNG